MTEPTNIDWKAVAETAQIAADGYRARGRAERNGSGNQLLLMTLCGVAEIIAGSIKAGLEKKP